MTPERATAVFRELLLDTVRVLGEQHPHTGLARYRLALRERDAGRTDQALEQWPLCTSPGSTGSARTAS